mmetsp:Transcript_3858/g.5901  ORF Transcript_3858/g.5901 Transcript_3858/m.5901 type:complete len:295 (+) Transcript_3858:1315-2199(+)
MVVSHRRRFGTANASNDVDTVLVRIPNHSGVHGFGHVFVEVSDQIFHPRILKTVAMIQDNFGDVHFGTFGRVPKIDDGMVVSNEQETRFQIDRLLLVTNEVRRLKIVLKLLHSTGLFRSQSRVEGDSFLQPPSRRSFRITVAKPRNFDWNAGRNPHLLHALFHIGTETGSNDLHLVVAASDGLRQCLDVLQRNLTVLHVQFAQLFLSNSSQKIRFFFQAQNLLIPVTEQWLGLILQRTAFDDNFDTLSGGLFDEKLGSVSYTWHLDCSRVIFSNRNNKHVGARSKNKVIGVQFF